MRVKIIANAPTNDGSIDISQYIGQIFEVEDRIVDESGSVGIDFGEGNGAIAVYKNEYEVVGFEDELKEFINNHYKFCTGESETIDFILENRIALANILSYWKEKCYEQSKRLQMVVSRMSYL